MWSDVGLGENKPKNTIAHERSEAGDFTAFADKSGAGTIVPFRVVVFVFLWCFGEDTNSFLGLVKKNPHTIFWNAGKINPHEHIFVLQHLELHEPFWSSC